MATTAARRRALLSVSDKRDLVPFARRLAALGMELLSTGGTFRALREGGVEVTYVTQATGAPELFDGRVKTLHPVVHGGILHRRDRAEHVAQAAANGIVPIDVVAVNLYPFRETVARPGVSLDEAIENIDVGGPAMIRAAAKSFADVTVIVSPDDYDSVARELEEHGATRLETRRRLALTAFRHTAAYDAAIASYLAGVEGENSLLPRELIEPQRRVRELRYGENPHQTAALYAEGGRPDFHGAQVLQGKELSYNNLIDLDAAWALCHEFDEPTAIIVKHTNPCGVGRDAADLARAWDRALAADPVSAFGGIVAVNRSVGAEVATRMSELFLEVVVAPAFDAAARELLGRKTSLRLVEVPEGTSPPARLFRTTVLGTLVQTGDPPLRARSEGWEVVTARAPDEAESEALRFLWRVCKHVKSNAVVIGTHERTAGVGAGQMSRVDSVELAVRKSGGVPAGAALASDAFFPFRDGLDAAARAGVRAVIQPGGSKRDAEVIAAANEHGIAMVFTGSRHFRH